MYKCKYCGKEFESHNSLSAHIGHCKAKPNFNRVYDSKKGRKTYIEKHPEKYILKEFELICPKCGKPFTIITSQEKFDNGNYSKFCSRSCANSKSHSKKTKEKISKTLKGRTDLYKSRYKLYTCKYCGKEFKMSDDRDNKGRLYCSNECKHKYLSEHTGGYRYGSGRGKKGWFRGIHCDSTWELAFLIFHLDNNLYIERCDETREYTFNGIKHTYHPDFVTDDGIIEIKGYSSPQWKTKEENNTDIKVLYKDDIKPYLDYAHKTYGNDLTLLYDNSKEYQQKKLNKKYIWVNKTNNQGYFINTILYHDFNLFLDDGWVTGRQLNRDKKISLPNNLKKLTDYNIKIKKLNQLLNMYQI